MGWQNLVPLQSPYFAVFLKYGQLYFSKATNSISARLSGLAKLGALTITLDWCISEATNQAGTTCGFYFLEPFPNSDGSTDPGY